MVNNSLSSRCTSAIQALLFSDLLTGHGPIWLSNVRCLGNESHLLQCDYTNVSTSYVGYDDSEMDSYTHYEDVGVACFTPDKKTKNRVS